MGKRSKDVEKCPLCSNHCPLSHPKCGKGRRFAKAHSSIPIFEDSAKGEEEGKDAFIFEKEVAIGIETDEKECKITEDKKGKKNNKDKKNKKDKKKGKKQKMSSKIAMEDLFVGLTKEEAEQFKYLFKKMVASWEQRDKEETE